MSPGHFGLGLLCVPPGKGRRVGGQGCLSTRAAQRHGFNSFSSQLDSKSVKHTALSLISVILKRALKTIDYCLDKEAWQESSVYTAAAMEDFVRLFREALSKVGTGARLGLSGYVAGAFLEGAPGGAQQVEKASLGAQLGCEVK